MVGRGIGFEPLRDGAVKAEGRSCDGQGKGEPRNKQQLPSGVTAPTTDIRPVRFNMNRQREESIQLAPNDMFDVDHDCTSLRKCRRLVWAALRVAETVPTSMSRAVAMVR